MSASDSTFILDDYVVNRKRIGKGSFSTIYKGYHKVTKRVYAIKEISVESVTKIKDNVKREFNLMKTLNHPNIVKLHNVILDNKYNNIYLVLDYYPNGDLAKFLQKKPLKEMYAQKYMIQLASGLEYLLKHKIIHRDLKPQNILITETYDLKITDFGFARYFDNDMMIHTLCGSPMYMAPEITKNKEYNIKSDLWSVGIILYEMLSGKPPFKAKNLIELVKCVDKYSFTLPSNLTVSNSCRQLLFGLLQKDPRNRIGWEEFLGHAWLKVDKVLENENKLLEISINTSFPSLTEYNKNIEQFTSFRHKSILEKSKEEDADSLINMPFQLSFSDDDDDDDGNEESFEDSKNDSNENYQSYEQTDIVIPKSKPIDIYPSINRC